MTMTRVQHLAEQIKSLTDEEREEFLAWFADYQLQLSDAWDDQIADDAKPGGRLSTVIDRVRRNIAEGRTRPIVDILGAAPLQ